MKKTQSNKIRGFMEEPQLSLFSNNDFHEIKTRGKTNLHEIKTVRDSIEFLFNKTLANANKTKLTEGQERTISGKLAEEILQLAVSTMKDIYGIDLEIQNSSHNYFKRIIKDEKGQQFIDDKIGVDYNIYYKGNLIAVVECKAYIDKCYLKRAEYDFCNIAQAIKEHGKDPKKIKYILFVMRDGIDKNSFNFESINFQNLTEKLGLGKLSYDMYLIANGKRDHPKSDCRSFIMTNLGINNKEVSRFEKDILKLTEQTPR